MTTLGVCIAILIFNAACLAVCIWAAVIATRGHLILARKDRAEILASKPDPRWHGCECLICRIFDKVTIYRGQSGAHG